jgi:hypothetical protein
MMLRAETPIAPHRWVFRHARPGRCVAHGDPSQALGISGPSITEGLAAAPGVDLMVTTKGLARVQCVPGDYTPGTLLGLQHDGRVAACAPLQIPCMIVREALSLTLLLAEIV